MDQHLADELVGMMQEDQRVLRQLFDSSESYHPRMKSLHEQHAGRLKEIISSDGWPGMSQVGEDAAKAAWLVAQYLTEQAPKRHANIE